MVSLSKFKKQGQHICTVFFDYNEAFDTASTGLCLQCPKIINYGAHQQILRWLTHYLCSLTQYVCVNGSSSDILSVSSGVLQASVLGAILFIIYTNDITDLQLSDGSMTLYADDIMLYCPLYIYTCWLQSCTTGYWHLPLDDQQCTKIQLHQMQVYGYLREKMTLPAAYHTTHCRQLTLTRSVQVENATNWCWIFMAIQTAQHY